MSFPNINFWLGLFPNWVDNDATVLTPGGEVATLPGTNVQTRAMGEVWRTPSFGAEHTQMLIDYGAGNYRPCRGLLVGNLNIPASKTWVRVQKGDTAPTRHEVFPAWQTNGGYSGWVTSVGAGSGSVSELIDPDFFTPDGGVVGTSNGWERTLYLRQPAGRLRTGARLQLVRVSFSTFDDPTESPTLTATLTHGATTLAAKTITGFPQLAVDGFGILDVYFDAADLESTPGVDIKVKLQATTSGGTAYTIEAVRWYASIQETLATPTMKATFEAKVNAGAAVPADVYSALPIFGLDGGSAPVGITPANPDANMELTLRWNSPPALGVGVQLIAICFDGDVPSAATIECELRDAGAATAVSVAATQYQGIGVNWLLMPFSSTDVATAANVELYILATADSGQTPITVRAIEWILATAVDAVEYDSGWIQGVMPEDDEADGDSGWDMRAYDDVGRLVRNSVFIPYFSTVDDWENPLIATVDTRYTLVEILYEDAPIGFLRAGEMVERLDVGRIAEGPGLFGLNLASGFNVDVDDTTKTETSDGGVPWEDVGETARILSVRLAEMPGKKAMRDFFEYVSRRAGVGADLLLAIFPEQEHFRASAFAWGPPTRVPKLSHQRGTVFAGEIAIKERV